MTHRCTEFIGVGVERCEQNAEPPVILPCPAGRPDAVGGPYCAEHGGRARALLEAESDWNYLAPASVGDAEAVLEAGTLSLMSEHAIVRIRREPEQSVPELWRVSITREQSKEVKSDVLAELGLSRGRREFSPATRHKIESVQRTLLAYGVTPQVEHVPARKVPRPRPWVVELGTGSHITHVGTYVTYAEAHAAGCEEWQRQLDKRIEYIRKQRGGTLEWGLPIAPRATPIVQGVPGD